MKFDDTSIGFLEGHIPDLANGAFARAYWHALASGGSVLEADGNRIFEVAQDGSRETVARVAYPVEVDTLACPTFPGQGLRMAARNAPRVTLFGGPNGSGKTTFVEAINPALLGVHVNADQIEKDILKHDFLDLSAFGIEVSRDEILSYFANSSLLAQADLLDEAESLRFSDGKLVFHEVVVNSYYASVAADFIRRKLIEARKTFSFETVMSFEDKIETLRVAKDHGFRVNLHFVATAHPMINQARVRHRVATGGHAVPRDKILARYHRSIDLLSKAIPFTDHAWIYDNSGRKGGLIAEVVDGRVVFIGGQVPEWVVRAFPGVE